MNLVFFDIECASVYKNTAKICAFGYVICDMQFNILKKEDILINPKGKFHLTDGRGEHGLVLPYEYGEFKHYPPFTSVYPQIRELLQDKNNLIIGHSTLNDVKYLDLETRRFNLPPFKFEFSDSQLMYMTAIGDFSRQFGLEYITSRLDLEFTPHRAADDAYATMKIVEAMCKKYDLGYLALEQKLGIVRGKILSHKVQKPTSEGYVRYIAEREEAKRIRSENRNKFYVFLSRKRCKKSGKLVGKTFTFSRNIEDDFKLASELVNAIYENGGKYSQKLPDCNVYVCENDDTTVRTANAKKTDGLPVLDIDGLRSLIND